MFVRSFESSSTSCSLDSVWCEEAAAAFGRWVEGTAIGELARARAKFWRTSARVANLPLLLLHDAEGSQALLAS